MLESILIAVGVTAGIGAVVGVILGFLGEKFKPETNEKLEAVRGCLAGSNCGGCGYAGCDAYARAIVNESENPSLCVAADVQRLSEVLGLAVSEVEKKVAFVRCSGTCKKTNENYNYRDREECRIAYLAPGHGSKKCPYGCCGFGTCAANCPYDAIRIVDGLAMIDDTKCRACGKCTEVCPNKLIQIIPYKAKYVVRCSSHSKGKDVRMACTEGCIGCGLCTRVCEHGAIVLENNLARIDQSKCTGCGKCAEKCPSKIILKR
ncbi:MAG: RnfABCDGE type electron transport complex subunit B [Clostridia bacterium]|nr:RnfABCDGE type electron transport complex subunit B [Clostridia bacterium]